MLRGVCESERFHRQVQVERGAVMRRVAVVCVVRVERGCGVVAGVQKRVTQPKGGALLLVLSAGGKKAGNKKKKIQSRNEHF